jgi:predicted acylesterase/phospholipase RssA
MELRKTTQRERDVAVVLSGGGMNGVLTELGFLRRLEESELWPRAGWIFGTSAGALSGAMAAIERLDDLEELLLDLQPEETFRPNRLWRLPLLGVHEYELPRTLERRYGDLTALAEDLAAAERELVVVATDASPTDGRPAEHDYELVYSSRSTPPEELAQAVLASAAISALVLPLRVGRRVATDGSWVRNLPLAHAYTRPEVRSIVAFRYVARYPTIGVGMLERLRRRLERFGRVPPIRAFIAELRAAEERHGRGEPGHLAEMILRLARAAIVRNTVLEERLADEADQSVRELARLRRDVDELLADASARDEVREAVGTRFDAARFPFQHERAIPRLMVRGTAEEVSLEPGFRDQQPWTKEAKRMLIRRGYELTDTALTTGGEAAYGEALAEREPGRR